MRNAIDPPLGVYKRSAGDSGDSGASESKLCTECQSARNHARDFFRADQHLTASSTGASTAFSRSPGGTTNIASK